MIGSSFFASLGFAIGEDSIPHLLKVEDDITTGTELVITGGFTDGSSFFTSLGFDIGEDSITHLFGVVTAGTLLKVWVTSFSVSEVVCLNVKAALGAVGEGTFFVLTSLSLFFQNANVSLMLITRWFLYFIDTI